MNNGAKHFSSGVFQNYLVFISASKYIGCLDSGTQEIYSLKSKGMPEESIRNLHWLDYSLAPNVINLPDVKFGGILF